MLGAMPNSPLHELSFVVTGTGRSGTGWAAEVLTRLGHPCGHESYFDMHPEPKRQATPRFPSKAGAQSGPLEGDSAFAAGAYLARLPRDTAILHLLRDPLDVLNSWVGTHFLAYACDCHPAAPFHHLNGKYARWMMMQLPSLAEVPLDDEVGRTVRWITGWTRKINARAQLHGLRAAFGTLEHLATQPQSMSGMVQFLTGTRHDPDQVAEVLAECSAVNAHVPADAPGRLSWDDLYAHHPAAAEELRRHALDHGYSAARNAH